MSNHTIEDQRTILQNAAESAAMGFEPTIQLVQAGWAVQVCEVANQAAALTMGRYSCHLWHTSLRIPGGDDAPINGNAYADDILKAMNLACVEAMGDTP